MSATGLVFLDSLGQPLPTIQMRTSHIWYWVVYSSWREHCQLWWENFIKTMYIPALGKQKQADFWVRGQSGLQSELQDSQGYTEKPCLENQKRMYTTSCGYLFVYSLIWGKVSLCSPAWLGINCVCRPGWSWTQRSVCICLLCYHT